MFYPLYGLRLEANVPIPGLTRLVCDQRPDVWVQLGAMPRWLDDVADVSQQVCYASPVYSAQGEPLLTVRRVLGGAYFRLSYGDGTAFLIDRAGTRLWSTWPDTLSIEDTAVYVLGRRCSDPEAPFVEEISAREALMTFVENTYVNYLLEPAMRAKEFTVLSRLVERVPIRRVNPHVDPDRLLRLCHAILDDSRMVCPRGS